MWRKRHRGVESVLPAVFMCRSVDKDVPTTTARLMHFHSVDVRADSNVHGGYESPMWFAPISPKSVGEGMAMRGMNCTSDRVDPRTLNMSPDYLRRWDKKRFM